MLLARQTRNLGVTWLRLSFDLSLTSRFFSSTDCGTTPRRRSCLCDQFEFVAPRFVAEGVDVDIRHSSNGDGIAGVSINPPPRSSACVGEVEVRHLQPEVAPL